MIKKRGVFRSLLSFTLLFLNILSIAWLIGCYMASIISPAKVKYLALLSLTTPFAIVVNIAFIFFWLFTRRKWRALFSLIILVCCYKLCISVFGINVFEENNLKADPGRLKVMTWNIHGLGIYDRPVDKTVPKKILQIIKQQSPDILCLPEFYTFRDNGMRPHSTRFLREGGFKEYRFVTDNTIGTTIYVGTAFYSKYPLKNFQEVELGEYIKMLQCDVILSEHQTMRTYFIHLQSFMLLDKEKAMIEDVKSRSTTFDADQSKSFIRRFNIAYKKRAQQVETAMKYISSSPYPVLICGDLNDLPGSYTYQTLKDNLKDAFVEKGIGLGRTYNQILPTLRIDYIFYDPKLLHIVGFQSPAYSLSDHNPVIANFEIAPKALY